MPVGLPAAALRLGALDPLVPLHLVAGAHHDAVMPSGRSFPCGPGRVIVAPLESDGRRANEVSAALLAGYGPFTWSATARTSLEHAIICEAVADEVINTPAINTLAFYPGPAASASASPAPAQGATVGPSGWLLRCSTISRVSASVSDSGSRSKPSSVITETTGKIRRLMSGPPVAESSSAASYSA